MASARDIIAAELAKMRELMLENGYFEDEPNNLDQIINQEASLEDFFSDDEDDEHDLGIEEMIEDAAFNQDLGFAQGLAFALRAIDKQ